jgi:hypothetical protein
MSSSSLDVGTQDVLDRGLEPSVGQVADARGGTLQHELAQFSVLLGLNSLAQLIMTRKVIGWAVYSCGLIPLALVSCIHPALDYL